MAIFHFSMKTISRSSGRSATAAIAYRAGETITDDRTGEVHRYSYKKGVIETGIVLPPNAPEWASNRERLWNEAEQAEKRKNSTVAREIVIALPIELNEAERAELVKSFAKKLIEKHQCAVDFAIHKPSKKGDDRNHHAHLLMTTRRLDKDGFTEKTRELDDRKSGFVGKWREEWANHVNAHLLQAGIWDTVSHLSLAEQGIDREPTKHRGVAANAILQRGGQVEKGRLVRQESGVDFGVPAKDDNRTREINRIEHRIRDESAAHQKAVSMLETEKGALVQEKQNLVNSILAGALKGGHAYLAERKAQREAAERAEQARRAIQAERERQEREAEQKRRRKVERDDDFGIGM